MRFAYSAFRHGVTEAQIRYVVTLYGIADDVPMASNPERNGLLFVGDDQHAVALEIIGVPIAGDGDDEDLLIIHAMPLRQRYRPEYERVMREKWGQDMGGFRTPSGQVLTNELIEAMAAEAEAGFSPEQLRPRPITRSPQADGQSYLVQYRVAPIIFEALLARAREEDRGVGEIARLALERYLCDTASPANSSALSDMSGTSPAE